MGRHGSLSTGIFAPVAKPRISRFGLVQSPELSHGALRAAAHALSMAQSGGRAHLAERLIRSPAAASRTTPTAG